GPYAFTLSAFNGTNPAGTWSLFVFDDQNRNEGTIANGWVLSITTVQSALPPAKSASHEILLSAGFESDLFYLTVATTDGPFVIESSTNLRDWTEVTTVTPDAATTDL